MVCPISEMEGITYNTLPPSPTILSAAHNATTDLPVPQGRINFPRSWFRKFSSIDSMASC